MLLKLRGVFRDGSVPVGTIQPLVPEAYTLKWPRAESGTLQLTVVREDAQPFDLTDGILVFGVRRHSTDLVALVSRQATVISAVAGRADFPIVQADTFALVEGWKYSFDIHFIALDGSRTQVVPPSVFEIGQIFGQPDELVTIPEEQEPLIGITVLGHADGSINVVTVDNVVTVQVGTITDDQHGGRAGGGLHALVTPLGAGFMSAADKVRLDNLVSDTVQTVSAGDASIVVTGTSDYVVRVGVINDGQHGSRAGGTTHAIATTSVPGFMSEMDKVALNATVAGLATLTATVSGLADIAGAIDVNLGALTLTVGDIDTNVTALGVSLSALTARTVTGGAGLTGGGDLSASRTLAVGANVDGSIVVNADDIQVGVLATDAQHGVRGGGTQHAVVTGAAAGFMSSAQLAALDGVVAAQAALAATFNGRTLTAGAGLTGGGDLSADRTFDVGANADGSIVVNANDVQVGVLATDAQHGARGGGVALHPDATGVLSGFMAPAQVTALAAASAGVAGLTARTLTAGAGLTGGGTLAADRTFNIVAADASIVVNADSIQVGVLATDAQHGVRGGGTLHADATTGVSGFMSAADKVKLDGYAAAVTTGALTATTLAVNRGTESATSGTTTVAAITATFAPASGTAVFRPLSLAYTVNQTGGASGAVSGIFVNATETAVGGAHNLLDLQVGGVNKFKAVSSGGNMTFVITAAVGVGKLTATSDAANGWGEVLALSAGSARQLLMRAYGSSAGSTTFGLTNANFCTFTAIGPLGIGPTTASDLSLGTNNVERVKIDSVGLVTTAAGSQTQTTGTVAAASWTSTFAPTSGTAAYRPISVAYTINQTGGANGAITGVLVNATETAVVGTHNLLDLQVAAASKFKVSNVGDVDVAGNIKLAAAKQIWLRDASHYIHSSVANKVAVVVSGNELFSLDGALYQATIGYCNLSINTQSVAPTSGTGYALKIPNHAFMPTSGTAGYRVMDIAYTVNQTGGANGAVTGLLINATETAVVGTHYLLDVQTAGTSKVAVTGAGAVTVSPGTIAHTSGTVSNTKFTGSFAPTSGTGAVRFVELSYTVNQTGGASGTSAGLYINGTETALGSVHSAIDVRIGGVNKFRVGTSAGITGIGFFNANVAAQGVRGATLTNSVTAGGTDDTIANFTDLTVYANDAAAIRNDIYQLARALRMHDVALRAYGLMT